MPSVTSGPNWLLPRVDGIPDGLKALPQWVNWRAVHRDDRWTKQPVSPTTGGLASSTDASTWGTFDQAAASDPLHIGFVFSRNDPYFGVDLDKCRDQTTGVIEGWALDIVHKLPNLYWEISVSGTGAHGIGVGQLPSGKRRRGKIEMYDRGRYFTVTGHAWPGYGAIGPDSTDAIAALHAEMFGQQDEPQARPGPSTRAEGDDAELIASIRASKQGELFEALFDRGDVSSHNGDDSAADLSLMNVLRFWTGGDRGRMERLFGLSALGQRSKWKDRPDYRERTLSAAMNGEVRDSGHSEEARLHFGERVWDAEGDHSEDEAGQSDSHEPSSVEPGYVVLGQVADFVSRFVAYPSDHARDAHTLWVAHAHLMDAWEATPRLAFLSPEPASGKSRALEITALLVPRPIEAVNVSSAALFRLIGQDHGLPTILYDEIDTIFGRKTAEQNEDIRGLINAGHRRGMKTIRCVMRGQAAAIEEFEAFGAVALAGLGDLPDTILTRSVIVRMRRRAVGEHVEPFRRRVHSPEGLRIRDELAAWAASVIDDVKGVWPDMPDGVDDRDADVWEPLIAVADAAGGDWPVRAREAATAFVAASKESSPSLGIRLLADLRTVFEERENAEKAAMHTDDLIAALCKLEESPWGEIAGGKPLNARGLSRRLDAYGVKSEQVTVKGVSRKGYRRERLADAWNRYLPPISEEKVTKVTPDESPHTSAEESVTHTVTHTDTKRKQGNSKVTDFARNDGEITQVTQITHSGGRGGRQGKGCVECGATIANDALYCARHGGIPHVDDNAEPWEGIDI